MQFKINPKSVSEKALRIIPVLEKERAAILLEKLSDYTLSESLFSAKKDTSYAFSHGDQLVFLIGMGEKPEYKNVENSFRRVLSKNATLVDKVAILDFPASFPEDLLEPAIVGFQLGAYSLGFFKKEKDKKSDFAKLKVEVISTQINAKEIAVRAEKIAEAKTDAFQLVDLPPNEITPEYLADWARKAGKKSGFGVTVFDRKKSKTEGLDAFLAVGRGSAKTPQFIIMEYRHSKAKFHLGLVGKGVTFDTGGLNVKTQGMVHMKSDMGGAAAVLATTKLISALNLPINLTSIVPAVENAIDKDAYLPSEVIGSHAGLSIEVIDTDAEGRLILADGLSYLVKNYKTDQIIDLATLTGSSIGTFGFECAALFSNDDKLAEALAKAGMAVGEKAWALPMWESYRSEMDSEVADIKNYHGKPYAGAITAAKFLEAFIHEHPVWAHLDIAGVAFGDTEFAKTKSGTAYGVSLLLKFAEEHI